MATPPVKLFTTHGHGFTVATEEKQPQSGDRAIEIKDGKATASQQE